MIDHKQQAFEGKGRLSREDNDPVGRSRKRRTHRARNIQAGMIGTGLALIDPLRSEPAGNPATGRPGKVLPPTLRCRADCAGCANSLQFRIANPLELGIRQLAGTQRSINMFDALGARFHRQRQDPHGSIRECGDKVVCRPRIPVEREEKPPLLCQRLRERDRLPVQRKANRADRGRAPQPATLNGLPFNRETVGLGQHRCRRQRRQTGKEPPAGH